MFTDISDHFPIFSIFYDKHGEQLDQKEICSIHPGIELFFMKSKHKKYKNKLTHSLRLAKWLFHKIKLSLMNHKSNKANLPSTFKLDSYHKINNLKTTADQFCEYCTNTCPKLAKNISVPGNSPLSSPVQQEVVQFILYIFHFL